MGIMLLFLEAVCVGDLFKGRARILSWVSKSSSFTFVRHLSQQWANPKVSDTEASVVGVAITYQFIHSSSLGDEHPCCLL